MLDKSLGNVLTDDDLNEVAGGINMQGTDGDLRRIKCPGCGEPIMVNVKSKTAVCPNIDCRCEFDIETGMIISGSYKGEVAGVKTVSGGFSGSTMKA